MRIIKSDITEQKPPAIAPMVFSQFSDDGISIIRTGDMHHLDEQAAADLERARREAEQLRIDAAREAENIREQARLDSEQILARAQQEVEQIRQQNIQLGEAAKKDGYASGFAAGEEDGYKKGFEDGYVKGKHSGLEEMAGSINMMAQVIEELKMFHGQILAESQKEIARMALTVARKILNKEIMTDPATVVAVVKGALARVDFRKQYIVHVNPLDLEVIKNSAQEIRAMLESCETLKFLASPQVAAGGCVVQTEGGMVDAQIDRQFTEVEQAVMQALDVDDEQYARIDEDDSHA